MNHYWPSPLPVLAGFATRTSKMLLGTDILVAPFYHPTRLAEDCALLDVMSNGRFVLGIAIGYKPDEFAMYGAELEKRGARFEEQLAIVKGLWTQDRIAFKGTYYQVEGSLEPKPVTKTAPPIWIGGWGDITLRRAATLADNWIPGPTGELPASSRARRSSRPPAPPPGSPPSRTGRSRATSSRTPTRKRASWPRSTSWCRTSASTPGAGGIRSSTPPSPPTSTRSRRTAS